MPSNYEKPRRFTKFQHTQLIVIIIIFPSVALLTYANWVIAFIDGQEDLEFKQSTYLSHSLSIYRDCLQDVKLNQFIGMPSEDVDRFYDNCMSALDEKTRNFLENPFKDYDPSEGQDKA